MGTGTYGFGPLNLLLVVLVFGSVLLIPWPKPWRKAAVVGASAKARRPLKPNTGGKCPFCQAEHGAHVDEGGQAILPAPWREGRSRRGRKKEIPTAGDACGNRACGYCGIMDQTIHALVADGTHGNYEQIQDLVCQACGSKFRVRRRTVCCRLKRHSAQLARGHEFWQMTPACPLIFGSNPIGAF